jgi:superoxide dismutase
LAQRAPTILDFQNSRAEYVQEVIDKLVNWEFATDILVVA